MGKQKFIILRGTPCAGKSTIAEELRNNLPKKDTAVIHTSIFYHQIVNGDKPEVAMENTRRILDNYLRNGYSVILEGTLSSKDANGNLYLNTFMELAANYNVLPKVFFLEANFTELEKREKKRKKISLIQLKKIYNMTTDTKSNEEIIINTTNKSINTVLKEIRSKL